MNFNIYSRKFKAQWIFREFFEPFWIDPKKKQSFNDSCLDEWDIKSIISCIVRVKIVLYKHLKMRFSKFDFWQIKIDLKIVLCVYKNCDYEY